MQHVYSLTLYRDHGVNAQLLFDEQHDHYQLMYVGWRERERIYDSVIHIERYHIQASMSGVGAYWDNAVVERFFGSLKHKWLLKVYHYNFICGFCPP